MKKEKTKSRKREPITTRKVQATEDQVAICQLPPPTPEADEDPWGADGLTLKQRLFVRFYVGEAAGNATKAAQLAGYRDDNRAVMAVTACENLRKPNIQRAIEREIGKRFGSPDQVKASIAAIANGNASDFLTTGPDGKLHVDLDAMAEAGSLGLLQQVQEERIEAGSSVATIKLKVKMYDRLRALELLAKLNGQLKDKIEVTGENGGPIAVKHDVFNDDDYRKKFADFARARVSGNGEAADNANGNGQSLHP